MVMDPLASNVLRRFLAFKYKPKESKQSKVDRLMRLIREKTGISRGQAEDIADAIIRNRELDRLALQKNWPMYGGVIEGPSGTLSVEDIRVARLILPTSRPDAPITHFPKPTPLPEMPTEAELDKAERRLRQTERNEHSTVRPGLKNQDRSQNVKRLLHKMELDIASGRLNERDLYDTIVNYHLLKRHKPTA
jgi:hypothetical protein